MDIDLKVLCKDLSILEKLYDTVRIVNPTNNKIIYWEDSVGKEINGYCYEFWKRNKSCSNCISMRAYSQDETIIKLEYKDKNVYMITAVPVRYNDDKVVVEFIKDITRSMIISNGENQEDVNLYNIIDGINKVAIKDYLTGLFNKRYIGERLPIEISNSLESGKPISVILIDIDNFKDINDTHGHLAGDFILKEVAQELKNSIRKESDWAARYGGEEFLVCLPNTDRKNAKKIAERIRESIENSMFKFNNITLRITASFGACTSYGEKTTMKSIIEIADKKLYKAKEKGKNIVIF
ncbi:GGDEF domain-containing protein [Thermohalobacter berrensis]|uniref:GGDEF domain-containing protein n=1 Tax=Thermohalobacter berrensis TaxID=99594 RepID=A0A419SUB7_9FIRM|nr:GGDEF domain-containing protein [Thermohalobacter berrensis]RKD28774.1 hypothetical protein BET03_06970 [Thermohalobacter berrensis]